MVEGGYSASIVGVGGVLVVTEGVKSVVAILITIGIGVALALAFCMACKVLATVGMSRTPRPTGEVS